LDPGASTDYHRGYLCRAQVIFDQGTTSTSGVSAEAAARGARVVSAFVGLLQSPPLPRLATFHDVVREVITRIASPSTPADSIDVESYSTGGGLSFSALLPTEWTSTAGLYDWSFLDAGASALREPATASTDWLADQALMGLLWQGP
jgi:hypothetical protein